MLDHQARALSAWAGAQDSDCVCVDGPHGTSTAGTPSPAGQHPPAASPPVQRCSIGEAATEQGKRPAS